jgi:hypothetical protein
MHGRGRQAKAMMGVEAFGKLAGQWNYGSGRVSRAQGRMCTSNTRRRAHVPAGVPTAIYSNTMWEFVRANAGTT